jgi:hypothetical protein
MESMDNFRERFEALEQQMKVMGAHTRTVVRLHEEDNNASVYT